MEQAIKQETVLTSNLKVELSFHNFIRKFVSIFDHLNKPVFGALFSEHFKSIFIGCYDAFFNFKKGAKKVMRKVQPLCIFHILLGFLFLSNEDDFLVC